MSGVVDLNVKVNKWKIRLSELENEAKQLKGKIAFAEEIIKEEETATDPVIITRTSPVKEQDQISLSAAVRGLFKSHPDMEMTNESIFQYLTDKGIPFGKPSVYATLSKLNATGIIQAIGQKGKNRRYKLKGEDEIPFSQVIN